MIEYIASNKEWIFSGIGVFLLTLLISFIVGQRRKSNRTKIKGSSNKIQQVSSKTENEIEIDGDMNNVNQS